MFKVAGEQRDSKGNGGECEGRDRRYGLHWHDNVIYPYFLASVRRHCHGAQRRAASPHRG